MKSENAKRSWRERITEKTWFKMLCKFFNQFMFIGVCLILISIIIDLSAPKIYILEILKSFLNSLGIALLIGAIFDFSKNSDGFMNYIAELLKDIIISKRFLNDLDINSKKQALQMVLRPSGNQLDQCSDIGEYFKKKINESMEMFHTNFKTNLSITSTAKKKDGKVIIESVLTYRIYKISDKYLPIKTGFERSNGDIGKTSIIYPDGDMEIDEKSNETECKDKEISPKNLKEYSFEIPKELYKYRYLTLKKDVTEEGHDHWATFHWNTLTPSDGVRFDITCEDDLYIQEYYICDDPSLYNIEIAKDKKRGNIVSTSWLDSNTGFIFIISDTKEETEI